MDTRARLRELPSVDELLGRQHARELAKKHGRTLVVEGARAALAEARRRIFAGETSAAAVGEADLAQAVERLLAWRLRRVLNATGVVLHTNLGRAPLAEAAIERVLEVARGYSTLEFDVASGQRGSRQAPIADSLCALTGAEAALAVNNNAAAMLLALAALAHGREVIVSRGELVEIGGGFRIPEVLTQSGARLVEVGTTNRTRTADYVSAIAPATALFLKVHRSNFALVGFTEEASIADLAPAARDAGLALVYDLGSGDLDEARRTLAEGASLVCFSGDKLLGGPQAGLIVGARTLMDRIAKHPLARAVRLDKMSIAALEATLALHRAGRAEEIPAVRALLEKPVAVRKRAERLASLLAAAGVVAEVVESEGQVGGGAMPLEKLPSAAVRIAAPARDLLLALRAGETPVIAIVRDDRVLLDVKALDEGELGEVARMVGAAVERLAKFTSTSTPTGLEAVRVFDADAEGET